MLVQTWTSGLVRVRVRSLPRVRVRVRFAFRVRASVRCRARVRQHLLTRGCIAQGSCSFPLGLFDK